MEITLICVVEGLKNGGSESSLDPRSECLSTARRRALRTSFHIQTAVISIVVALSGAVSEGGVQKSSSSSASWSASYSVRCQCGRKACLKSSVHLDHYWRVTRAEELPISTLRIS